jgi:MFS family permease
MRFDPGEITIRPLRGGVARHWYLLPICLLACLAFAWVDTVGDWNFFRRETLGSYYDAQANSILHGHLDVPKSEIIPEAFVRGGKFYGYFGMAPALPRMVLNAIWPQLYGRWSRLSMMLACIVNVMFACLLAINADNAVHADPPDRWRKLWIGLFAITASVGSTNLFLASRAHAFHEAIIWAGALGLACCYFAIRYRQESQRSSLVLLGIFALLAFFCRATVGAGCLLLLTFLVISGALRLRRGGIRGGILIPLTFIIAAVVLYFTINYAKFHTFDGVPVRLYEQYIEDPSRMKITGGRQIHPENLRAGLYNYFTFSGLEIHRGFPWLFMTYHPTVFHETHMDCIEDFCSIPAGEPGLAAMALIGVMAMVLWRRGKIGTFGLPALAMFAGGSVVLVTVGLTERYMHDFYPFLIVAGAVGAVRIGAVGNPIGRWVLAGTIIPLSLLGVCTMAAFTIDWQRTGSPSHLAAAHQQYLDWQSTIDSAVARGLEKL